MRGMNSYATVMSDSDEHEIEASKREYHRRARCGATISLVLRELVLTTPMCITQLYSIRGSDDADDEYDNEY
jgi:hypothetical protein